jgi:hypothetical protein
VKVRISDGLIRFRIVDEEVDALTSGAVLEVAANESVTFTLRARDIPQPLWTASAGTFSLDIPASELLSPSRDNPLVYTSDGYLVELDLKPGRT